MLGARIYELREAKGMSVKELSEKLDCSARSIQRIEAGTMVPSVLMLFGIADALGVKVDDLRGHHDDNIVA